MMQKVTLSFVILIGALAYAWADPETKPAASVPPAPAASTAAVKSDAAAARPDVEAIQIGFATAISSMMPVNPSTSFDDTAKTIYFWNRLRVKNPPARISHVWYRDDQKTDEFKLEVRYPRTRMWTHKNVSPGLWKVEIVDDKGGVIMTGAFVVKKRENQP